MDAESLLQRSLLGYLSKRSGQTFSLVELINDEKLVSHLKKKVREAILNETTTGPLLVLFA